MKLTKILSFLVIFLGDFTAFLHQIRSTARSTGHSISTTTNPWDLTVPIRFSRSLSRNNKEQTTIKSSDELHHLTSQKDAHAKISTIRRHLVKSEDTNDAKRYRRNSDDEEYNEFEEEDALPNPAYRLRLSEFNFDNPGVNTEVFVELEATKLKDGIDSISYDLSGFKLLILKGEPLEIVLVVDMHRVVKKVTNPFIVLGKGTNPQVHIDLASLDVQSVFSDSTLLPGLDDSLYAVLIVFSVYRSELNELSLDKEHGKFVPKRLDPILRNTIRDITVDMQVVGRKVHANHCNYFDTIRPLSASDSFRKVLLRDWDSPQEFDRDFSINNCCPQDDFFDPYCWYVGTPTPGSVNDCSRKQIILEELILDLPNARLPEPSGIQGECSADYPGVPASSYDLVNDLDYVIALGNSLEGRWACSRPKEFQAPEGVTLSPPDNNEFVDVNSEIAPAIPFFSFQEEKFRHCSKYLTQLHKLKVPKVTEWLYMNVFTDKCIFSCHICKTYFSNGFRPDIKHKKRITNKGFFSKLPYVNKDQILDHVDDPLHQDAREYYLALKSASTETEVQKAVERAESVEREIFRPTMNALALGYTAIKAGVSYRAFPIIHQGVKELGVSLGSHHNNVHSLQLFSETFSNMFHKKLLVHLVENNVPFSFLSDATTYQNVPYFVCLLQSIEDGYPIIYFWGLIELTNGEASKNIWADVETRIRSDDSLVPSFEAYFKQNLIAFISDMAGVMIGCKNSVWTQVKSYIRRDIPTVCCSNHRLERVIHHALNFGTSIVDEKPFRYYHSFRDKNNKFYSFYMSFGSKRWAHLKETAKELGLTPYRIKYHFSIRWAASSKKAMDTLYRDYQILISDLQSISTDTEAQPSETRDKATDLYRMIVDKTFAITVAEFVDFLSVFEKISLSLQTKSALLIGKVRVLRAGMLELRDLKLTPGKRVTEFLSKCSCVDICQESECNLSQYDSCEKVLKGGIEFRDIDTTAAKLSEHRLTLYSNIEQQMKTYFDSEQLEAFDLFDPRNFKWTCPSASAENVCNDLDNCFKVFLTIDPDSTPTSAAQKFDTVCKFYYITPETCARLIESWKSLLEQIVTSAEYERMEYDDPSRFWPNVLLDDRITMHDNVKTFIQRLLVTGLSNSESERAFSISTRFKSGDRSTLSTKNLEALLRISINGPDTLNEDSIYGYAKAFLKTHSRVDDVYGGGRVKSDFKSYFAKSRLF